MSWVAIEVVIRIVEFWSVANLDPVRKQDAHAILGRRWRHIVDRDIMTESEVGRRIEARKRIRSIYNC